MSESHASFHFEKLCTRFIPAPNRKKRAGQAAEEKEELGFGWTAKLKCDYPT
jgi:hypothetical protein